MANLTKEKELDEALLAQFNLDPHLKITTSLTIAIHRQLIALSNNTGVAIEEMNREFLIENLANVTVTEPIRLRAKNSVSK